MNASSTTRGTRASAQAVASSSRSYGGAVARVRQHDQVDLTDPLQERVARRGPPRVAPPDDSLDLAPERLERGLVLAEGRMDDEGPPRGQRAGEEVDELGRPVAGHDVARRHVVIAGEGLDERRGLGVRVARDRRERRQKGPDHLRRCAERVDAGTQVEHRPGRSVAGAQELAQVPPVVPPHRETAAVTTATVAASAAATATTRRLTPMSTSVGDRPSPSR